MRTSNPTPGLLAVLVVAIIGILVALQGWQSRVPFFDMLLAIDGAHELVAHGQIPDRGSLTSYASHNPPGGAWLMAPGLFLFTDPRLFEYAGSVGLYVGTVLGIFLLARSYFGVKCAIFSVALYGLSEIGLRVAGSLWERLPLHFFYVWMVYWASRWVSQKEPNYLAAALIAWAAGMYVFMEIAPALFILPAIWLIYRPPVRLKPLIFGGLLALVIWYPYVQFQSTRNFMDFKAPILRQKLLSASYRDSWCDRSVILRKIHNATGIVNSSAEKTAPITDTSSTSISKGLMFVVERGTVMVRGALFNFEHTAQIPGNSVVLLLIAVITILASSVSGSSSAMRFIETQVSNVRLTQLAVVMILTGILANEFIVAGFLSQDGVLELSTLSKLRWFQSVLVMSGLVLMAVRRTVLASIKRLLVYMEKSDLTKPRSENARLLAVSLVIPWIMLLLLVENTNHLVRLWWLWPLQAVFLSVPATYLSSRSGSTRLSAGIGSFILAVLVIANPLLLSRLESWLVSGWAGDDAEEIKVVEYTAKRIILDGKNHAAIGYDIPMTLFNASFNASDRRYKVGAKLDLLFKYRHGITNTDRCAEGFSPDDEYRIAQPINGAVAELNDDRFEIPHDPRMQMVHSFKSYRVLQRH